MTTSTEPARLPDAPACTTTWQLTDKRTGDDAGIYEATSAAEAISACVDEHSCHDTGPSREDLEAEPVTAPATCECGTWSGVACEWSGLESELVTVEYMPEQHRGSHAAAGNRGIYPHNGAVRLHVSAECADLIVESEGDWAEIVEIVGGTNIATEILTRKLGALALSTLTLEDDGALDEAIPYPLAQRLCASLTAAGVEASWAPDHDDREMAWVYVVTEPIVEIEYAYVVDHAAETGTWTGKRSEAIEAGASQLGADEDEDGTTWTYYADETASRWRVSTDDLAVYGAAVLSGHPREAYSLWCAGSCATEVRS